MPYSSSAWRNAAAPIIADVIASVGTKNLKALNHALQNAYPWGKPQMHPYKIWRDEIRRQLAGPPLVRRRKPPPENPQQTSLF